MKYINPDIGSSYRENDLGRTLYDLVLKYRPKKIVEIGILHGYSTIAMAMAIDEIGEGQLTAYDLFEDYKFKHGTESEVRGTLQKYSVDKYVTLVKMSFEEWLANPSDFDFLHLDISNNGDSIERLYDVVKTKIEKGAIVTFEGGTEERDQVTWMRTYTNKPIRQARVPFTVVNSCFPGLSKIDTPS